MDRKFKSPNKGLLNTRNMFVSRWSFFEKQI